MIIRNIEELAMSEQTTVDMLKSSVQEYTDYDTYISWNAIGINLTVSVPDTTATMTKSLSFPFTDVDFYDAVSGLQCYADYMYCEANKEEV